MSGTRGRRRIKLETRHGNSRESRSRKDRPCDTCRNRKSACVIAVQPPCRFCELRGLECTFTSNPRPRHRADAPSLNEVEIPSERTASQNKKDSNVPLDKVSPQAFRFPVPPRPLRRGSDEPSLESPSSTASFKSPQTNRQYLSLEQLISEAEIPSPRYSSSFQSSTVHEKRRHDLTDQLQVRNKHSLEHGKNLTAHFIGLSGEQDTNLFAQIRYNVLNETKLIDFNVRKVYAGDPIAGTPPIHLSILHDVFPERDQSAKRLASDAIEGHVGGYGDALLRLYFRFVHPILPILSKAGILMSYATDKFSIPASLRGAIYGLACAFWSQDPSLEDYPAVSQVELFEHTHAALNRELDSPKLSTLQACLLVLHEQPDAGGTTESPRIWAYACQATACAQSLGLHQDPTLWKLPTWEKRLRRKLWWATYTTDIWTSICHGNTPHITAGSFDTSDLDIADLAFDEDVAGLTGEYLLEEHERTFDQGGALRFLEVIKLTKILGTVLADGYTLQSYRETIQKLNIATREAKLWQSKLEVERSLSSLPDPLMMAPSPRNKVDMNGSLYLAFFAVKSLILRALMAPATSESKSSSSSRLCVHYGSALSEGEAFMDFMTIVSSMDLHAFWPRHCRTNLIIAGNFLIYLFFCASTEQQVAKAYDMLQKYQDILREMAKVSDWSTIGLIRPTLLRTDSFFHGAAEGIRLAGRK